MPAPQDVYAAAGRAKEWLLQADNVAEIAFFGGSFTAIRRDYMESLLCAAQDVVTHSSLLGIRISTRPDAIDEEILTLLRRYGVTAIELGAQSMCDAVLLANQRGHDAEAVVRACGLIRDFGFELGLQMMTGLYLDTQERSMETARRIIALRPDTVRLYPTLVLRGTGLEALMQAGRYRPQTLEEAVSLCAQLLPMFESAGIRVIRVGLHDEPSLKDNFVAGPYHPAFRELCLSRIFLTELTDALAQLDGFKYNIKINPKSLSAAIGQKRCNAELLAAKGYDLRFALDPDIPKGQFVVCSG